MEIRLLIGFRGTAQEGIALLPPDLQFLAKEIKDSGLSSLGAVVDMMSTVAQTDRIIEWGRATIDGQSIIRAINVEEIHDDNDLSLLPLVEIAISAEVDNVSGMSNSEEAFYGYWECGHCNRIRWEQIEDYNIELQELDFQQTAFWSWIVSARVREVLKSPGVTFRRLMNSEECFQLITENHAAVATDVFPMTSSIPCLFCNYTRVGRLTTLEGDRFGSPGITIIKKAGLTVRLPDKTSSSFFSTDVVYRGRQLGTVEDRPAEPIGPDDVDFLTTMGRRNYFLSQAAYRKLLEMNVTGLGFGPVNVISE